MKGTNDKPGLIRLAIRDVFDQIKNSVCNLKYYLSLFIIVY